MVKFFAILWIVITVFLFIGNYTQGRNHRTSITDYRLHGSLLVLDNSSSATRKPEDPGVTRGKRFTTGFSSLFKLKLVNNVNVRNSESNANMWLEIPRHVSQIDSRQSERSSKSNLKNDSDSKESHYPVRKIDYTNNHNISTTDPRKSSNASHKSSAIQQLLDFSTTPRNNYNYSSPDYGNARSRNSQDHSSNEFATVFPVVGETSTTSNDPFTKTIAGTRTMSSTSSYVTNRNDSVDTTTRGLTLVNFRGPLISQDAESLEDGRLENSKHIRVKRDSRDFDKIADLREEEMNLFKDDKSKIKNELGDAYPDLVDDPLNPNSRIQIIGRKRFDYEMLFPRSNLNAMPEVEDFLGFSSKDDSSSQGPSLPKAAKLSNSFAQSQLNTGFSKVGNIDSNFTENYPPIDRVSEEISTAGETETENSYSKLGRKRYSQFRGRIRRKAGIKKKGKNGKSKHRKKHKKKRKKQNKPATTEEKRGADETNGDSNIVSKPRSENEASDKRVLFHPVDELQVEKRDSGEARLKIDITERKIPDDNENRVTRGKRTIENEKILATTGCKNERVRCYDDVYEPDLRTRRDYIVPKSDPVDRAQNKKEAKSIRQIKNLTEKLIGKIDELDAYINSGNNEEEREKRCRKKAEVDESSTSAKSVVNITKDCSSRSKEKSRSKFNVETNEKREKTTEEKRSTRISRGRRTPKKSRMKKRKSHRKWDRWTDWSSCSVTCGKGRQIRWRHCIHECTSAETEMEEKSCQLPACGPGKFLGIF